MPPCDFILVQRSTPTGAGDQFTVALAPPLRPGCRYTVEIGGKAVKAGDRVGDLKAVGFGATGEITLEAMTDRPVGTIRVTMRCEDPPCGPTVQSLTLGDDSYKFDGEELFKSITLPFGLAIFGIALFNLLLCELLCFLYSKVNPGKCDCALARRWAREVKNALPRWLRRLL